MRAVLRSLLGGGLLYFAVFVVVHAVLAFTSGGSVVADAVCLALVALPQLVLVRRRSLDLPAAQAGAVCGALVAAAVIGLWTMPLTADTYVAWFLGAITFDLLGLAVLGRAGAAWLTMAAIAVLATLWAPLHGLPASAGPGMLVRHVATLLVGTALAISLRRSNAAFSAFSALRQRRLTEEQVAATRLAARRSAAQRVLDEAGPSLRRIAAGTPLDEQERRRLMVLEGALRDQIRTPLLMRAVLRTSVDAARGRDVNVLLMDEAEQADPALRERAIGWLAERLDAVDGGGFVGRVRAQGTAVRVSAVREDHGESHTFGPG